MRTRRRSLLPIRCLKSGRSLENLDDIVNNCDRHGHASCAAESARPVEPPTSNALRSTEVTLSGMNAELVTSGENHAKIVRRRVGHQIVIERTAKILQE